MCTVVIASDREVRIPDTLRDLDSFRRWAYSPDFPDQGAIAYIRGEVWVDMSPERLESHAHLKGKLFAVLSQLVEETDQGRIYPDGALLTNRKADLCTEPDAIFFTWETLKLGRVKFVGDAAKAVEIEGSPDMVLEVVSDSSERKDKVVLLESYWQAGVREYWLVDARGKQVEFRILARGPRSFRNIPAKLGWQRSPLFAREFKLRRRVGRMGLVEFDLRVRS